jgi:hypothetical protein
MPPRLPDAVEHLPLARLIPYARNARTHDDDQVAKIAASIVDFGWLNPVLIDDAGNVIAGHGRLLAAQKLGLDSVPLIRAAHLTPAQVRAYRLGPWDRRCRRTTGDVFRAAKDRRDAKLGRAAKSARHRPRHHRRRRPCPTRRRAAA